MEDANGGRWLTCLASSCTVLSKMAVFCMAKVATMVVS